MILSRPSSHVSWDVGEESTVPMSDTRDGINYDVLQYDLTMHKALEYISWDPNNETSNALIHIVNILHYTAIL